MTLRTAALAVLLAVLVGIGWWGRSVLAERDRLELEVRQQAADLAEFKSAYEVTSRVLTQRVTNAIAIKKVTQYVQVEIEKRIPDGGVLPADWRLLHDAAATGEAPAPSGADEAPLTPKDAARTVADNYGTCRDTADQLTNLQDWLKGVAEK